MNKKYNLRELWEEINYHANRHKMIGIDYLLALMSFYKYKGGKRKLSNEQLDNIAKNSGGRIMIGRAFAEQIIFYHLLDTLRKDKNTKRECIDTIKICIELLNKHYPSLNAKLITECDNYIMIGIGKNAVQIEKSSNTLNICKTIAESTYGKVWESVYAVDIFNQAYEIYKKYT